MSYVYKFLDVNENVIYVGRTNNILSRIKHQHFTKNGHLSKECYNNCEYVEYAKVVSHNESRLYELYLISKLNPKFNSMLSNGGELTFDLPELSWIKINMKKEEPKKEKPKIVTLIKEDKELIKTIKNFDEVIAPTLQLLEIQVEIMLGYSSKKRNTEGDIESAEKVAKSMMKNLGIIKEHKDYYQRIFRNKKKIFKVDKQLI